jgi:predicted ATP-binding protein involved in virulence
MDMDSKDLEEVLGIVKTLSESENYIEARNIIKENILISLGEKLENIGNIQLVDVQKRLFQHLSEELFESYKNEDSVRDKPFKDYSKWFIEINNPEDVIAKNIYLFQSIFISYILWYKLRFEEKIFPFSESSIDNNKKTLPNHLKQLLVYDFLSIESTKVSDIPQNANIVFLTGKNGFGKTSVLQAIALGLSGNDDDENVDMNRLVVFTEHYSKEKYHRNYSRTLYSGSCWTKLENLCTYGPSRLEITNDVSKNELSKKSGTLYSLFNTDGLLLNIERELLLWYLKKNNEKYDSVRKTLLSLLIGVEEIKVDTETDTILYKETESKEFLPFQHIASGYRSIIAMMGDMIIRLFKSQPEITNPSELAGIVIIDELDLHLHPKWQYELPQMLVNTFPKIQFIVSTHSVIPFLGAPENSVFLKVTRDKENGTKVHKIEDLDIKNLTPNSILTSPIFDMDVITQINNENKEEIHTEENYDAILKRKETQKKLKELAKDFQFPENPS